MKQVSMCVIGTNRRAKSLLSQPGIMKQFKLVALCDKFDAVVKHAHNLVGDSDVKCYTDHKKMLKEVKTDAVFICVAPVDNADLVCECLLEHGKHVMCEVPLAYSIEDCWKIVLAVEKSGLKFQMAEQTRYWPFAQAWKRMVQNDELGKVVYAEGQYFHGMHKTRYFFDKSTGQEITYEEAQNNPNAIKSRAWNLIHPIMYIPHDLGPILNILDDRVTEVTCMGTQAQSYRRNWLPIPDVEIALMKTAKDTVIRMGAGFTVNTIKKESTGYHWYHMMGTKGTLETNRSNADKMKFFSAGQQMTEPAEYMWQYSPYEVSLDAIASGHAGADYYPFEAFIDAIINDTTPPMDVYQSAENSAPAILAAKSIEQRSIKIDVPDFRPGPRRKKGQKPTDAIKSN